MTVRELINLLGRYGPDVIVKIPSDDNLKRPPHDTTYTVQRIMEYDNSGSMVTERTKATQIALYW